MCDRNVIPVRCSCLHNRINKLSECEEKPRPCSELFKQTLQLKFGIDSAYARIVRMIRIFQCTCICLFKYVKYRYDYGANSVGMGMGEEPV